MWLHALPEPGYVTYGGRSSGRFSLLQLGCKAGEYPFRMLRKRGDEREREASEGEEGIGEEAKEAEREEEEGQGRTGIRGRWKCRGGKVGRNVGEDNHISGKDGR